LAIVNGAHETNRLTQLLEGFIKRFVQCGQCNNPETDIVLTKKETIELVCKACGAVTQVDMRHKLCTFILKNPPVVKDKAKKCAQHPRTRTARPHPPWPQAAPRGEGAHQGGRGAGQAGEGRQEEGKGGQEGQGVKVQDQQEGQGQGRVGRVGGRGQRRQRRGGG